MEASYKIGAAFDNHIEVTLSYAKAKKLREASGEQFGTHLDSILDPIWM